MFVSLGNGDVTIATAIQLYVACSFGTMVVNKVAIEAVHLGCTLVTVQTIVAVVAMFLCWPSLHFGSVGDVLRWSMVAPFFTGVLLTSILALKDTPMSLLVVFRSFSVLLALVVERFFPNPLRVTQEILRAIFVMIVGALVFVSQMPMPIFFSALPWVSANTLIAVADRLLQRLMLARDQCPVDISLTGTVLLNNLWATLILGCAGHLVGEHEHVFEMFGNLTVYQVASIVISCVLGIGISFAGVLVQKKITATSFLMVGVASRIGIITYEAFFINHGRTTKTEFIGALIVVLGSFMYARTRESLGKNATDDQDEEKQPLVAKCQEGAVF